MPACKDVIVILRQIHVAEIALGDKVIQGIDETLVHLEIHVGDPHRQTVHLLASLPFDGKIFRSVNIILFCKLFIIHMSSPFPTL